MAASAYVDEEGVDPDHRTETLAELELRLDTWRWHDTTFRLRAVPHLPGGLDAPPNVLRFGLEPEYVSLKMSGVGSGVNALASLGLDGELEPGELPPYGRVLLDVLRGDPALSVRGDEAEESWRVVTPVLDAWAKDLVPLEEYPAGSDGPAETRW